jgi:DNA-binding SARP family transcriptional activator/TolB-like protein
MSAVAPSPHESPFRLRLFGGVLLEGSDGPVGGRTSQRRQLAVLAVLAATDRRGVTREKLLGVLWCENEEAKARHQLSDALYNIRHDLGEDAVLDAGGGLCLNPARVWCDARAFDLAVEAGDRESAAALYAGPFLDGFYLDGEAAFEDWKDAERHRYATAYAGILEELALAAEASTDFHAAALWWQRAAVHDPYNSRVCLALMRALAAAGDPANALTHLAEHARVLRDQLEIDPDPEVLAYGEKLRAALASAASAARYPAVPTEKLGAPAPLRTGMPATPPSDTDGAIRWRRRRTPTLYVGLALTAVVVGTVATIAVRHARARHSELDPHTLAVVPFTLVGTDNSTVLLADRMPELIAGVLTGSRDFRLSDVAAVRAQWVRAGGTGAPVDAVLRVARASGAGMLMVGSVLEGSPATRIAGELYDVETGRRIAQQALDVDLDQGTAAAEALLVRLLAEAVGEPRHRVPLLDRHPREAVLAYLAARDEANSDRAIARAREALRLDSTLGWAALVWYRRVDREFAWLEKREAAAKLWDLREGMGPEDQAFVEALVGGRRRALDDGRAEIARWERAAEAAPEWMAVQTALGWALWLHGPLVGMLDWPGRAAAVFDRTIAQSDSSDGGAIEGAWWIALSQHDTVQSRRLLTVLEPQMGRSAREFFRWATAIATGDSAGAAQARKPGAWGNRHVFRSVALPRVAGAGTAAVDAYLAELPNGAEDPERQTSGTQGYVDGYIAYYERDRGHYTAFVRRRPFSTIERWQQYMQEIDARPYWAMLLLRDALYLDAPEDSLVHLGLALFSRIADDDTLPPPEDGAVGIAHCWRSQWRLAHGDTTGADAAIRYLRDLELRAQAGEVPELDGGGRFVVCPALLEAQRDRLLGRDAEPAVRRLDTVLREEPLPPEGYWFVTGIGTPTHDFTRVFDNLLAGRMLAEIGDTAAALAAVRRRPYQVTFVNLLDGFLVAYLREEGKFAAAVGDTAGAMRAYRHYLALRLDRPDFPPWRAQWDSVTADVAAFRRR